MFRFSKKKRISVIIISVIALMSIGLMTFYLINGNSFDMRSSAGSTTWEAGDLNADKKVTMADFNVWLTGYRKFKKDGTYSTIQDLNKDKKIAFTDFFLWLNAYREYKGLSSAQEGKTISRTSTMGTFKLDYEYMGDNTWFYKVTGNFGDTNKCDTGTVNIGITKPESLPETVNIYMNGTTFLEEPSNSCPGTYTKEGEITASSNANIVFALRDAGNASMGVYKSVNANYTPMTLTYEYKGNNTWSYAINGDLPNGCFEASSGVSVTSFIPSADNAGEKVYVFTYVSPERIHASCTQAIVKYSKTGTFSASPFAKVALVNSPVYPESSLMTDFVPVLKTVFSDQGEWWTYTVTGTFPSGCYSATTTVSPETAIYSTSSHKSSSIPTTTATETKATLWTFVKENTSGACTAATVNYSATGKITSMDRAGLNSFFKVSVQQ